MFSIASSVIRMLPGLVRKYTASVIRVYGTSCKSDYALQPNRSVPEKFLCQMIFKRILRPHRPMNNLDKRDRPFSRGYEVTFVISHDMIKARGYT